MEPDTAIVAADPLCQQALDCQAEDMAIEDTLYALERALTDGHLPSDTYLKQVRPYPPLSMLVFSQWSFNPCHSDWTPVKMHCFSTWEHMHDDMSHLRTTCWDHRYVCCT